MPYYIIYRLTDKVALREGVAPADMIEQQVRNPVQEGYLSGPTKANAEAKLVSIRG